MAENTKLMAAALEAEHGRHGVRLQMLKRMEPKLRALDEYMPAVRAAGINVHPDELHMWSGRVLFIADSVLNAKRNTVLERVLIEQGMREVSRKPEHTGFRVELKKGHLLVSMHVRGEA